MEDFELARELLDIRQKLDATQDLFLEISRTLASHRAVIDKLVANETAAHRR